GRVFKKHRVRYLFIGKSVMNLDSTMAKREFAKASVLAGDDLDTHKELAKAFKTLKLKSELSIENEKISQLESKRKFEEEIRGSSKALTPEAK
ncbi:MAG: hypothetical protein AABZ57_00575, partial [Candidatus Margulisiibacteriota bacterium]